jgi:hypothetical protein
MKRKIALAVATLIIAASAGGLALAADGNDDGANIGLANPASVFCEEQGGTVEIVADEDGNQRGNCQLADGSEIDEWEYWRQFHGSGVDAPETGGLTPLAPQGIPEPDPSDVVLFIDGEPVTGFDGDSVRVLKPDRQP